jgi:hypothetical protein
VTVADHVVVEAEPGGMIMGLFRKRKAIEPLVVDRSVVQPGAEIQDNFPGREVPDFEAKEAAEVAHTAAEGPAGRTSIDPESVAQLRIIDETPKEDD